MRGAIPGIVLCLHGIWSAEDPSAGAANISTTRLEEVLGLLGTLTRIIPLAELLQRIDRGRSIRGLSAITFDDAYSSVSELALPLLQRHQAPACVFAVSETAATGARYWWDRVEDLHPRTSAARWRRLEDDAGLPESYRAGQPRDLGPLRPLRQWILSAHRGRLPASLATGLSALESELGWRTTQRSMTIEELRSLSRDPLISLGAHTHTHAALALLTDEEVRQEIATCVERFEEADLPLLPILAAPYGLVDARTPRIATESGLPHTMLVSARSLWRPQASAPVPRVMISEARTGWRLFLNLSGATDVVRTIAGIRSPLAPPLPSPTT